MPRKTCAWRRGTSEDGHQESRQCFHSVFSLHGHVLSFLVQHFSFGCFSALASFVPPIRAPLMPSFFSMILFVIVLLSYVTPVVSSYIPSSINSLLVGFQVGIYTTDAIAMAAFGISGATADTYFIDSGCTLKGLTGYKSYNIVGNLHFPLASDANAVELETLVIKNVLYDPTRDINFVASDDINAAYWDVNLSLNPQSCGLFKYAESERLLIAQVGIEKCWKLHTHSAD
eukprot:530562-Rhodomonas_salina.1